MLDVSLIEAVEIAGVVPALPASLYDSGMEEEQTTEISSGAGNSTSQTDDQLFLAYVRDRDAVCPLCRYNLRGLTIPRCPECGNDLKLSVGLVEPFMRAWIACAVATCLSAGIGLFIVIVLLLGRGTPRFNSGLETFSFFSFVGMIPVALLVLTRRSWFLRQGRDRQVSLAVFTVLAVVIQFGMIPAWM